MKRSGVKKTADKKRKSSETSVAMPLGRVMAPPLGQTKRILEPDKPAPDSVTRQKGKMAAATDHRESPLYMDSKSSVQMGDEFPHMDEETTLRMDERDAMTTRSRLRKGKGLEKITKLLGTKANFEMNTDSETIKTACKDILHKNSKNILHQIKKKYFDTVAANKVNIKSPVPDLTDGECQAVVEMWSTQRHKLEMEKRKDASVPEGEEPKSNVEIVKEVLKTEVKQSTFLGNVGLHSSRYNSGKATAAMVAHVRDLEHKLERSELQTEVMQEEMATIKMKAEESKAEHGKELELLCKKSQE
ncbi:hypothetical protein D1007_27075 [Hordeum vulgare]|nr:hypothetical protein D1007_27075 [Hordeum vulgare]